LIVLKDAPLGQKENNCYNIMMAFCDELKAYNAVVQHIPAIQNG